MITHCPACHYPMVYKNEVKVFGYERIMCSNQQFYLPKKYGPMVDMVSHFNWSVETNEDFSDQFNFHPSSDISFHYLIQAKLLKIGGISIDFMKHYSFSSPQEMIQWADAYQKASCFI